MLGNLNSIYSAANSGYRYFYGDAYSMMYIVNMHTSLRAKIFQQDGFSPHMTKAGNFGDNL